MLDFLYTSDLESSGVHLLFVLGIGLTLPYWVNPQNNRHRLFLMIVTFFLLCDISGGAELKHWRRWSQVLICWQAGRFLA